MPDRFYDGQRGPDIRRELNNLEAVFDDAIANARGPRGWTPVVAVVADDARRVLQIADWTGGEGSKPAVTGFIGGTGIVATAALAVDIRGSIGATGPSNTLAIGTVTSAASPSATITGTSPNQTLNLVLPKGDKGDTGNTGPANTLTIGTVTTGAASATITGTAPSQVLNLVIPQGIQGIQGDTGWSPIFATVVDGERRVLQLVDWTGGTGSKPATGEYVGATGLVATVALAVDIRGPSGTGTGNVNPTGVIAANDLAAFADSTGQVIKALKAADLPVSTATQTALNGKAPLDGTGTSGTWPISTTGNAATATKLATARTINGTAFDGSADISVSVGWESVTGKPAVIAAGATQAEARTAIGAGTSSLTLGVTAGTALAGDTLVLPDAPSDGKTYGRKDAAWVEVTGGVGGITNVTYDDRGSLRSNTTDTNVLVDGLGLFQYVAGSDEPDDDESCFATATGRWLLQAAHWDLVDAWQLPDDEARDAYDEDEPLRFASKVLTGSATCAITSVAAVASTAFTGTVTGAAVGDRVIATPPAALGNTEADSGRLSYHAYVSAADTVTVRLTNASAATSTTNVAIRTAWPITVIKS